jgi:hypothetical protein
MRVNCVFLDNGGVITDNTRRGPRYRRLVGQFFVPRFGGEAVSWETANATVFPAAWERFVARLANWDPVQRDIVQETSLYYLDCSARPSRR